MKFQPLDIVGAYLISPDLHVDNRGYFGRTFCEKEYSRLGLETKFVQSNVSFNKSMGTLRGLHFQKAPYEEVKLVSCTAGSVFDVLIDLRVDSDSFLKNISVILNSEDHCILYVPKGVAHGFLTMQEESVVSYQMSEFYQPNAAAGLRWNDAVVNVIWPGNKKDYIISERDSGFLDFLI